MEAIREVYADVPELMRLIAARLREFTNNRRYATRYRVRLPFDIVLLETQTKVDSARHPLTLDGYTYDLSATGVGLITSAIRIGGRYLTGPDGKFDLTLRLPTEPIQMLVNPVRYEHLDEDKDSTGYLIGVHITAMSTIHRANFDAYLRTLR